MSTYGRPAEVAAGRRAEVTAPEPDQVAGPERAAVGSAPSTAAPPTAAGPTLSRRASLNAFASGLDYAVRTGVELVINPLLVAGLGGSLYGAWRVLWRWTGYVWATSGRSAQALQWAVANRQRSTDYDEKRTLVASAVVVWVLFLPLLLAVGGVGVWAAPGLLDIAPADVGEVRAAAAFLVLDAVIVTLVTLPRSVLQGENLGYKRLGLSTVVVIANGGLTAAALWLDTGITGVAVAHLIGTVLMGLLFWRVTRGHVPWFGMARPSRTTVKWFLGLSWWFTVWKMVMQLMVAGDVLVLGVFGSVQLVTVYTFTKYVPEALTTGVTTLVQGATPGLGGIIGAGDNAKAVRVRREMLSLTWLVAVAAGSWVVLWNESFVRLWVGERYYSGSVATLVIVAMVIQFVLIRIDAFVIDLTLEVRSKVLVGLLSTLISLVFAAVAVAVFDGGIVGLALGIVAGRLVLSAAYPTFVGRSLAEPLRAQLRGLPRPLLAAVAMLGGAYALGGRVTAGSWLELVVAGAATAVLAVPVAALAGLSRRNRAHLLRRARHVVSAARRR